MSAQWRRSFVATSVVLGGSVDEALSAIDPDPAALELADRLRAPGRAARAAALAGAAYEIARALDQVTLR